MTVYQFNYFIDVLYIIASSSLLFLTTLYFRYLRENEIALENEKKQIVLKQEREIAGEVQKKLFPGDFSNKDLILQRMFLQKMSLGITMITFLSMKMRFISL